MWMEAPLHKKWIERSHISYAVRNTLSRTWQWVRHIVILNPVQPHWYKVFLVQKARQFKTVKIVSFDWLEDTLLKERPVKESEYLMAPLVKCAKDIKEKKKAVRNDNIEKGSK